MKQLISENKDSSIVIMHSKNESSIVSQDLKL